MEISVFWPKNLEGSTDLDGFWHHHTVDALQGKMCQNSLPSEMGRSLGAKISGGRGRPWGIFFGFYKTRHILLSHSANCTVLRAVVLTQVRTEKSFVAAVIRYFDVL